MRPINQAGNKPMTPHLEAAPDDYAEIVLLPGDPLRAKWIAETFFDDARCVNQVRNCLGFTGFYKGTRVSVQATGMGQPSLAIYATELLTHYGVKSLVRVGTCGGLNEQVAIRDTIIAMAACTDSSMNRTYFGAFDFAPVADFDLLRRAVTTAEQLGKRHHVGAIISSDVFYADGGLAYYERLRTHGVLGVEMETSALYTLAARHGARALSVCAMTDCLITGKQIDSGERQSTLTDLIELSLEAATAFQEE